MISRTTDDIPPFPSDVAAAPIATISLAKILDGDSAEAALALEACRTHGFFYLDLTTTPIGRDLINDSEDLQHLAKQIFDKPFKDKDEFALVKGVSLFGYK